MSLPATKANACLTKLNAALAGNVKLGDIDKYEIRRAIGGLRSECPEISYVLEGSLAAVEKNVQLSRKLFAKAVKIAPYSLFVQVNLAVVLTRFGFQEEVSKAILTSIELCESQNDWSALDTIINISIISNNTEALEKIVALSNKLNLVSDGLTVAAAILSLQNLENRPENFDEVITDEFLRQNSVRMNSAEWKDMEDFADKISAYLD